MPAAKHKSNWMYEALPYFYMGSGVLVSLVLGNAWGLFSGLLLVSAGVMVWWMRRSYRRSAHRGRAARGVAQPLRGSLAQSGRSDAVCVQLQWKKEYECGIPAIDAQHRHLFELGNTLLNAVLEKKPKLDVELLLDELIADVTNHFCAEEAMLARSQHPLTNEHIEAHRRLLARCKEVSTRFHRDDISSTDLFNFFAVEIVASHIVNEDLKLMNNPG